MTRDDIIAMAREAGLLPEKSNIAYQHPMYEFYIERFAALVAAHEREMCAKVADAEAEESVDCCYSLAVRVAKDIRARGDTK